MGKAAVLVGSALAASAVGLGAAPQATASGTTQVVHFAGESASAVLTDCVRVPGTRCRAVSVNAFEQRVHPDGPSPDGPFVLVTLFDVTIVGAEPGEFVADEVGSGLSHDVTVAIPHGLPHGTALAPNVALERCEFPEGDEAPMCGPAGSVSVEARWEAAGPTTTTRFHEMFADPFGRFHDRWTSTSRRADASGTLDGSAVEGTPLFPAQLSSSRSGSVSRFGPLAMSTATAVDVATAASVAHTSESSASAALTNCPPAPPSGTVCDGVLVNAFSMSQRDGSASTGHVSVSAAFFELTITPEGFNPRFVGSGSDSSATFEVADDLLGATAIASIPLEQCDEHGCVVTETRALQTSWTGEGDLRPFRFHSQFAFDGEHGNTVGRGASRDAVAAGVVNGAPFTAFPFIGAALSYVTINGSAPPTLAG